jgi:hypothetical protein
MQVFISYASEDRKTAEEVHFALVGAGHQTFFDKQNLPPGGDYHSRIAAAVAQCDAFVFLLSPESIARGSYALTELKRAKSKWVHAKGRVLPVMVRAVAFDHIPAYLSAVTVLEPEGNLAAEVVIAVAGLSPPSPGPGPRLDDVPPPPSATIRSVKYQHNLTVASPMGPGPGMQIDVGADIHNVAGRSAQLVVKFAYFNGPPLYANPQELTFRDTGGLVATGTPPRVLALATEALDQAVTIPYYALNFQPTQGMAMHNLTLVAFVFVDGQLLAQSAPVAFTLRW